MPPKAPEPHDGRDGVGEEEFVDVEREGQPPPEVLVPAVVRHMRDNQDDVAAALFGLYQLGYGLAVQEEQSFSTHMNEAGAVHEVAQAMTRHSSDEEVAEFACTVLYLFLKESSDTSASFRVVAEATNGCASVASAMRTFPDNKKIQLYGGDFLCLLAQDRNVTSSVFANDGISVLMHALSVGINEKPTFCQNVSGCVLRLLSTDDESGNVKRKVEETGGISLLVDMTNNPESTEFGLIFAFKVLYLMAEDDALLLQTTIAEIDVFPRVLDSMHRFISNDDFQYNALRFLSVSMRKCPDMVGKFLAAGGVDFVGAVMNRHRNVEGVALGAVIVLTDSGQQSSAMIIEFASKGIFSAIVGVLAHYAGNDIDLRSCAKLALVAEAAFDSQDATPDQICVELAGPMSDFDGNEALCAEACSPGSCSTPGCKGCLAFQAFAKINEAAESVLTALH